MGWLNGQSIDSSKPTVCRSGKRADDTFTLSLSEGENILLMKVTDRTGGWNLQVSFGSVAGVFASVERMNSTAVESFASSPVNVFDFSSANLGQLVVADAQYVDYEIQKKYVLTSVSRTTALASFLMRQP